jgi:hypothetical protein
VNAPDGFAACVFPRRRIAAESEIARPASATHGPAPPR